MAPPGDVLAPSSLLVEGAAVAEDVLGIGGVCGFQGLSLSEAAVATNKEVRRPVKGRAGDKEEVVKGEAEAGCFKPVAIADVEEAPATGGIKGKATCGGYGLDQAENAMWILPDKEVQFVLSQKEEDLEPYLRDGYLEYQAWMRREYEANGGRVLVDDEMAAQRAEHLKTLERDFLEDFHESLDGVKMPLESIFQWTFSDRDSDFFESDEEGEEAVQAPPVKAN